MPYTTATPAQMSAKSTACSLKKSTSFPFTRYKRRAERLSAAVLMSTKTAGAYRMGQKVAPRSAVEQTSSGCGPETPTSAADDLACLDLLGVDLLQRPPLLDAGDLALGGVRRGDRQLEPELVRHGADPLRDALELRARGPDLECAKIEEPAG